MTDGSARPSFFDHRIPFYHSQAQKGISQRKMREKVVPIFGIAYRCLSSWLIFLSQLFFLKALTHTDSWVSFHGPV